VELLDEIPNVLIAIAPAFLVGVLLVLLGKRLRSVVLFWRGRSPRVQIAPFSWAAGEGDRESLWVTSLFRGHLKDLQLDGLDPVPDRAPGAPLVEIVEGVGQGIGHGVEWGKVMGRLYRAIVPDCAYEAWATLRPQGEGAGLISIQLIKRAGGNRTLVSFTSEAADWDACAREAAMAAAGALYPHLASRYKGPWADWKQPVPAELLGLYQGALRHEQDNQFEQALGAFRETVEKDPLNPQLRLKAAMLEERLGLHLDAWFTYWAIVAESDRRVWKGPHRRTRLVSLYRLAIHLWNPHLAKQWVDHDVPEPDDTHGKALALLRPELRSALEREYVFGNGAGVVKDGAASASAFELMGSLALEEQANSRHDLMTPFEEGDQSARRPEKIAEVLQIVSLNRLEELKERMSRRRTAAGRGWPGRRSRRPPLRSWPAPKELPALAVEASELLVRTRVAESIEARLTESGERIPVEVSRGHVRLLERWPFPRRVKRGWGAAPVRRARVWLGDRRKDAWQLHYNAACAIATQLSAESIRRDRTAVETTRWAKAAIEQLESFSYHAGSARVATMADWIAFEDPDLADLYEEPEFRLWGSQRFGFELPRVRPARDDDVDRHTVLILKRSAAAFAASWRSRAGTGSVPPPSLLGWWEQELEIWERLETTCREYRSWRHRLEGLKALQGWNAANQPPTVDFAREKREYRINAGSLPTDLLDGLRTAIDPKDGKNRAPLDWVAGRAGQVTTAHGRRLRAASTTGSTTLPRAERQAAIEAATLWSRLEAVLATALLSSDKPDWKALNRAGARS
jgi:hypothetical protein